MSVNKPSINAENEFKKLPWFAIKQQEGELLRSTANVVYNEVL